ncbi:MAG: 6-phosphogluconolactonase [Armatimonadota bacterium]
MATTESRPHGRMWRIVDPVDGLYRAVADAIAERAQDILRRQARFTMVLSGGNTPRALYALLANAYRHRIDWNRVHFFWGDERYVPLDHPASNYRMAREVLIDPLEIPRANVHPMPVDEAEPRRTAQRYEEHLRETFGGMPRFDLILLGMGSDGHTASLFPNTPALAERERWVAVGEAPTEPRIRLTLTLPVLNAGRCVYFLVTGADKAEMVRKVLLENAPVPAGLVRPEAGELVWWLDAESAAHMR